MEKISLIYSPSLKDLKNSEVYNGVINATGTKLYSKEESLIELKEIYEKILNQKEINKSSPLMLDFVIGTLTRWSFRNITGGIPIRRFTLSYEHPSFYKNEGIIDFGHSLVFPFGKEKKTIEGKLIMGPLMPEILSIGIKDFGGRKRKMEQQIKEGVLDEETLNRFLS